MSGGTEINIVYTENGVEALFMSNGYSVESLIEKNENIISQQEVEKMLMEKYNNLIAYDTTVFTNLEIVYVPLPSNFSPDTALADYYTLTPVWCFTDQGGNNILFDAVSGKEVV